MEHLLHFLATFGRDSFFVTRDTFSIFLVLAAIFIFVTFIFDKTEKKNAILRNYPVIGHARYIGERLGVYLRQYFYAKDREELPFNRNQRDWIERAAENDDTTAGFGSTRDLSPVGTILFVDAPFPTLGRDATPT